MHTGLHHIVLALPTEEALQRQRPYKTIYFNARSNKWIFCKRSKWERYFVKSERNYVVDLLFIFITKGLEFP